MRTLKIILAILAVIAAGWFAMHGNYGLGAVLGIIGIFLLLLPETV